MRDNMREIPEPLRFPDKRFVKVGRNSKKPFENEWQKLENAYLWNDPSLLKHLEEGGNVGVLCGEDLIIIDADSPELQHMVENFLPTTFRVKSPRERGGVHNYFKCKLKKAIRLRDIEGKNIGDVQSTGKQALCPPSIINSVEYRILEDVPIAKIAEEELRLALFPYIAKEKTEFVVGIRPPNDIDIQIENVIDLNQLTKRGNEYYGSHPIHGSEGGGKLLGKPLAWVMALFQA